MDRDFAPVRNPPPPTLIPPGVFSVKVYGTEIAQWTTNVPNADEWRQAVTTIAQRYTLPSDWINDVAAGYDHHLDAGEGCPALEGTGSGWPC